jgi:hypothetical protein
MTYRIYFFMALFLFSCGKEDVLDVQTSNEALSLCYTADGANSTIPPAQLLNLLNWKLTLPTGSPGLPDEISQPQLATFSVSPYFLISPSGKCVIFNAHAGGVTTPNSIYPRSELREQTNNGSSNVFWDTDIGKHSLTSTVAITHLPSVKPDIVVNQIHDALSDLLMVRLVRKRLYLEGNDPTSNSPGAAIDYGTLESNYQLGTFFTVRIVVENNKIDVYYNNLILPKYTISLPVTKTNCFFRAGAYTHSNVNKGDLPSAYGEAVFTYLDVEHQ